MKRVFLLIGLVALSAGSFAAGHPPAFLSEDASYQWPTNASRYMSSTFGETRSSHFHSAIDIGTWGHEGYPVFATRAGQVYRVRVSPQGYGKVVYLRHDDDTISLYAHLRDFAPQIRSVVDSVRLRDYSFTFDRRFEDEHLHFEQGEVIGYSGSTGVGPPHLHFELRSPDNRPFNPLLTDLSVPDNIPPRITGLAIEPLEPGTRINGERGIRRIEPQSRSGNTYYFGEVEVAGEVGLAVHSFDRADGSNNTLGIYERRMFVNDELFFHAVKDSFSFSQNRQLFVDRSYPTLEDTRQGYKRLYRARGNSLPFNKVAGRGGLPQPEEGIHNITFEVQDFSGNSARGHLQLKVNRPEEPNRSEKAKTAHRPVRVPENGSSDFADGRWFQGWMEPAESAGDIEAVQTGSFRNAVSNPVGEQGDGAIRFTGATPLEISGSGKKQRIHRVVPGSSSHFRTSDQRLQVSFGHHSVFDTLSVTLKHGKDAGGQPFIELQPTQLPLAGSYTVSYLLEEELQTKENIAFYSRDDDSEEFSRAGGRIAGSRLLGSFTEFGRFYIVEDETPPEISEPQVYQRSDGRWFASVTVKDPKSGIDYEAAHFYVNNQRGIAEYDPEKNKLIYYHPEFVPRDRNELQVVVPDNAGNTAGETFQVGR